MKIGKLEISTGIYNDTVAFGLSFGWERLWILDIEFLVFWLTVFIPRRTKI